MFSYRLVYATACLALCVAAGCKSPPKWEKGKKYFHYALRAKVDSFDPVRNSTSYANFAQSQVYETLFQYKYLVVPYELEPLLAAQMPEVSEDGRTYTFELRRGVRFHDDECFPGGKGREVVARDQIWSMMRMTDKSLTPSGWWLYQDRIVGFDDFQKRMSERKPGEPFDWNAEVEGLRVLDSHRFQIELVRPFPQFLFVLAMGYTAVIPRECAEHYGKEFGNHAVGTGPFVLREWVRGSRIVYDRNPAYREAHYPSEAVDRFRDRGLLEPAGRRIPFLDGIVFSIYEQDQPMWLKFRAGDLDMVQVPAEYHDAVFDENLELRESFAKEGIGNYNLPLLDFIYRGFNMEDPITGKGERAKKVRQAMSLALDTRELSNAFYNDTVIRYDGPIPPGLDGYEEGVLSPYRGPDIEKAKRLLAEAGYPNGEGLPPIHFHTSRGGNSAEQAEMVSRQMKKIGIRFETNISSFPELSDKMKRRKAQMFGLAWGADYPDAENFLQLFYGPNASPGSNGFNYSNPEFDALYEKTRTMQPSPARTEIYKKMRDMIIEDVPAMGSMARTRFYVWSDRVKWMMPSEVGVKWFKYIDVEPRE